MHFAESKIKLIIQLSQQNTTTGIHKLSLIIKLFQMLKHLFK